MLTENVVHYASNSSYCAPPFLGLKSMKVVIGRILTILVILGIVMEVGSFLLILTFLKKWEYLVMVNEFCKMEIVVQIVYNYRVIDVKVFQSRLITAGT